MAEQPAEMRYSDVTLFAISKKAEHETATISEMGYADDLTAALRQGELLLKSMEQVCGSLRQAIFIVYKDFGHSSAKTFNLPDWLISRDHYIKSAMKHSASFSTWDSPTPKVCACFCGSLSPDWSSPRAAAGQQASSSHHHHEM